MPLPYYFIQRRETMTNILTDISKYDAKDHMAYPTLSYILQETGEDIIANQGSELKANAYVKQMTKTCWSILASSKDSLDTISRLEYKIATDEKYRKDFIDYVCSFIYDLVINGADMLFNSDKKGLQALTPKTRAMVQSSSLAVGRFVFFEYNYRVGY